MHYTIGESRARVWTYRYPAMVAESADEAQQLVERRALREVPDATVETLRVKRTPTGRYSVTVRRVRTDREATCAVCGDQIVVPWDEDPADTLCVACADERDES